MKRCPKCNLNYTDDTLEFCLEDGSRLIFPENSGQDAPTVTLPNKMDPRALKTAALPFSETAKPAEQTNAQNLNTNPQTDLLKEKVAEQSGKILAVAPIIVSLAHNWWQWLYLEKLYYSSFTGYVFSANFLMWLLLLVAGIVSALFALRRIPNKSFAITSLVILAVNLLLFLVPRR
jgi:hypothetical protein